MKTRKDQKGQIVSVLMILKANKIVVLKLLIKVKIWDRLFSF